MFFRHPQRRIPVYSLAHCLGPKSALSTAEKTEKQRRDKDLPKRTPHENVFAGFRILVNTRNLKMKADSNVPTKNVQRQQVGQCSLSLDIKKKKGI